LPAGTTVTYTSAGLPEPVPRVIDPTGNAFPWLLSPVLMTQGLWVRARTPRLPEAAGPVQGRSGSGPQLNLCALGDSIIAGVGVDSAEQALPAQVARSLARRLNRCVHWHRHGHNGARTADLLQWAAPPGWQDADLLLVSNGLNDVTGLMAMDGWLRQKEALYRRLGQWAPGALVAQLGLPPLGQFPALPHPLRWLLGRRAEAFDLALESLCEKSPQVVHLPFRARPDPDLFAADGYHPGPAAVTLWAESLADALAPLLAATPGIRSRPERSG